MTIVKVMYWKDIPCSVRAEAGRRNRVTRQLPEMYMATVDAVAMKEGAVGSDEYQAAFHWGESQDRPGISLEEAADAMIEEIVAAYPKAWLVNRAKQAGVATERGDQ